MIFTFKSWPRLLLALLSFIAMGGQEHNRLRHQNMLLRVLRRCPVLTRRIVSIGKQTQIQQVITIMMTIKLSSFIM
jgi:hypothetical protein